MAVASPSRRPFPIASPRARVDGDPARRIREARIAQNRGRPVRRDRYEQIIGESLALLKTEGSRLRIDGRRACERMEAMTLD